MNKNIAVIRGDGIGPEIVEQALGVLNAVAAVLDKGYRTADIWSDDQEGCKKVGCKEMGQRIIENLRKE